MKPENSVAEQSTPMDPQVQKYLQDLLRDAGQTDLGEELEEQMMKDLYSRLEDRLIITAIGFLGQKEREQLEGFSDDQTPQEVQNFLKKHVPNYDRVFAQVLLDFRNLYIEAVQE